MSSSTEVPAEAEKALQFDQAEYSSPAGHTSAAPAETASCAACNRPLDDVYYEANGKVICPSCKEGLQSSFSGGSKFARTARALLFGGVTAVAGSFAYWGIRTVANAEWALVAIALGWLVGAAVQRGARSRGGWFYQFAAVLLTYLSISFSYVPDIVSGFMERADAEQTAQTAGNGEEKAAPGTAPLHASGADSVSSLTVTAATEVAGSTEANTGTSDEESPAEVAAALPGAARQVDAEEAPPTAAAFLFALAVAVAFTLSVPVLLCTQSPIMILIYGFGLFQAWQMNRRPQIAVSGPFSLQSQMGSAGALPPLPGQTLSPPPPPPPPAAHV